MTKRDNEFFSLCSCASQFSFYFVFLVVTVELFNGEFSFILAMYVFTKGWALSRT